MEDFVIVHGDQVTFLPAFGPAVVVVRPGVMQGSGKMTLKGKKVCIEGDEKQLSVPGCMYTAGPFSIPGVGTIQISALGPGQLSQKTKLGGKALVLKGTNLVAKLMVQTPAQQPAPPGPPVPDPAPQYAGSGSFITTNATLKAG
ncbi:hypothetical protein [Hymenobacter convexus]|uniref:hypothetical protein n=1 Tax=Hymenobacter sp. CA1UV-4 TaxID=3063782 RepID=UPI002712998C|nr:hypothetical protein [Hymenobacter sp. CA1UV-4]MDO7854085.1 hypothetical protein [Hymenobacter sp. CA1UV-4]